ncbi:MAG: energy transducer TonB, partial [Brevundimonas sp.]
MTAETHARDPILDPPRKKKGLSMGALVGITVSALLHVAAGVWLYTSRFELKPFEYTDDAVDVELIEPAPPPPPVTLNIEPTKKEDRVEYAGPPVIGPGPPPPPAPPAPVRPSV